MPRGTSSILLLLSLQPVWPSVIRPPSPSVITSLADIAANYDAILLDQFGVLHDGANALPSAVDCYSRLAALGKKLVVVSNTSRRRAFALSRLPRLGFDPESLAAFVCSGEQAWAYMATERRGQSALWISWSDEFPAWDPAYMDGTGVTLAPASEADFVLCQGSMALRDGTDATPTDMLRTGEMSSALEEALRVAVSRGLPLVCANPDLHVVLPDGSRGHMPGLIAQRYAALGGQLVEFGKPHAAAFEAALAELGGELGVRRDRVLHVGDSLEHDIAGANAAGIHSLFVCGGIHAGELGEIRAEAGGGGGGTSVAPGDELEVLFGRYGARPTHTVATFRW